MRNSDLNEVRSRGTPDFPLELYSIDSSHSRYIMPFHWHNDFEIVYIESGEFKMVIGETEYIGHSGDAFLVGAGQIHGGMPTDCVYHCVVFNPELLLGKSNSGWRNDVLRICDWQGNGLKSHYKADSCKVVRLIKDLLFALRLSEDRGRQLATLNALYGIFATVIIEGDLPDEYLPPRERTLGEKKMKKILAFIEDNYADTITLKSMASVVDMNVNYFCEFFRRHTHQTPINYLNAYRVDGACRMLKVRGCTVTEAAYANGFNDLSYFVKTFKKYKGITPKQYRRSFELK